MQLAASVIVTMTKTVTYVLMRAPPEQMQQTAGEKRKHSSPVAEVVVLVAGVPCNSILKVHGVLIRTAYPPVRIDQSCLECLIFTGIKVLLL